MGKTMKESKPCVAIVVVLLAVSLPLTAQPKSRHYGAPEIAAVVGADGSTFAETLHAASTSSLRVRPNVTHDSFDNAFIFPLAGNAAGAFNTFFRSEATLINNLERTQVIRVWFFPVGGQTCSGVPVRDLTLGSLKYFVWSDFVSDVFGINGLGSLGLIAVDSSGNADATARVDATLRIWTPAAGGGSASQTFESAGLTNYTGFQTIFGLRHDGSFRSNFGIFNYLGSTRTFDVNFYGLTGVKAQLAVTAGPCSVAFQSVPNNNYGSLVMDITPRDSLGGWYGFGSSVDNTSGDSWSLSARP